jgi:hypothetical protein
MMMQMAQQMMANGGMDRIMSNPAVANMVRPYHALNRAVISQPNCLVIDESYAKRKRDAQHDQYHGRSCSKGSVSVFVWSLADVF